MNLTIEDIERAMAKGLMKLYTINEDEALSMIYSSLVLMRMRADAFLVSRVIIKEVIKQW